MRSLLLLPHRRENNNKNIFFLNQRFKYGKRQVSVYVCVLHLLYGKK
jgi:hypothetical protein